MRQSGPYIQVLATQLEVRKCVDEWIKKKNRTRSVGRIFAEPSAGWLRETR